MTSFLERTLARRPGTWTSPFSANLIAETRVIGSPLASPDGQFVAYVQDYDQGADLFVVPYRGRVVRTLVRGRDVYAAGKIAVNAGDGRFLTAAYARDAMVPA